MKKIILIGAVVIVVLGLIYVFTGSKNKETTQNGMSQEVTDSTSNISSKVTNTKTSKTVDTTSTESSSYLARDGIYVIQYTDDGFVPKTIQIPRGKGVRFVNQSSRGMRIFSDANSDSKFVDLNQSKTLGKGGTYTFSFVTEGLWQYHNEVQPSDKASITVY
jgi:plastocyanin